MTKLKLQSTLRNKKRYSNNSTIETLATDIINDFEKEVIKVMYKPDYDYDPFNVMDSLIAYFDETKKITRQNVLDSFKEKLINEIKKQKPEVFDVPIYEKETGSELLLCIESKFELYSDRFIETMV